MHNTEPRSPREINLEPLNSPKEIAKRLGVPTSWVYRQIRLGGMPFIRLGKYRRLRFSAVMQWIEDRNNTGAGN